MSNLPDQQPSDPPDALKSQADALEHVVDDIDDVQSQSADWVREQLLQGATLEGVTEQLVNSGWERSSAEALVERVRKETRRERGVLTRADVVDDVNRRYRQSMAGGWFAGMPTISAARRLIYAVMNVLSLNRFKRRTSDSEESEQSSENRNQ